MSKLRASFYITGGTLPDSATCYVERTADAELHEGILSGSYVYVLDSRQMGKSSLCIRTLTRLTEQGVATAFVDLTKFGVKNVSPDQWFVAMLREVGRGLGIAPKLTDYWRANLEVAPVQRFFGALQNVALLELNGPIAIFVDEIDVTRSLPFDTDEFFAGIRQCYIGRATDPNLSRLTFSLFGTATPAELIKDTRVSPFNIGHRVELKDFGMEEASVLAQNLPGNPRDTLSRILHWTGGHPYLTQRLCQLVCKSGDSNVDAACRSLFFERKAKESDDNLAFVRNRLLNNEVDMVALLELYGKALSGKRVADDETNPLCSLLRMSGVTRVDDGFLRVRNRIYSEVFDQKWIQSRLPDGERRRQRAAFRRGVIRATAFTGAAVAIVGGLAIYGFLQARLAKDALQSARNLTASLTGTKLNLQQALSQSKAALAAARESQARANSAAAIAEQQRTLAKGAAAKATKEAAVANTATALANERLSQSLISSAMQRLDSGDPAGAIEPLTAAIRLDKGDKRRSQIHAVRMGYALRKAAALRQLWSGKGRMIDAEYLPDGAGVFTANEDGEVTVWNAETGERVFPSIHVYGLTCVALAPNGRTVATGTRTGHVGAWDLQTGKEKWATSAQAEVTRIAVSDDCGRIAAGMREPPNIKGKFEYVRVWDIPSGQNRYRPFADYNANIQGLKFSPSGKRLIVMCAGELAESCDLGDGLHNYSVPNCYDAREAQFVRNGRQVLINGVYRASAEGSARLCQLNGASVIKFKNLIPQDGDGIAFRLSSDGETLLTATNTGALQLFDFKTGAPKGTTIRCYTSILDCDLSFDGRLIASADSDGAVRIWSTSTGQQVGSYLWHGSRVTKVLFNRAATRVLSCSDDGTARIWEVDVPGLGDEQVGPNAYRGKAKFFWTKHGSLISSDDFATYRWDPGRGWRYFLKNYTAFFSGVDKALSRRIFIKGDAIRVYDFDREAFITRLLNTEHGFSRKGSGFGLSPDGRYLFDQFGPNKLRVSDLDNGKPSPVIDLPNGVLVSAENEDASDLRGKLVHAGISSECRRLFTLSRDRFLDLWDIHTGRHVCRVSISAGVLVGAWWDGRLLCATVEDRKGRYVVVIGPKDGRILKWLPQPYLLQGPVFSADEKTLVDPDGLTLRSAVTWNPIVRFALNAKGALYVPISSIRNLVYLPKANLIVDLSNGRVVSRLSMLDGEPVSSEYSSDGKRLIVCTRLQVYIIDSRHAYRNPVVLTMGSPSVAHFVPDSSLVMTENNERVRLWDADTGEEVVPSIPTSHNDLDNMPEFSGMWVAMQGRDHVDVLSIEPIQVKPSELLDIVQALSKPRIQKLTAEKWHALNHRFPYLFSGKDTVGSKTYANARENELRNDLESVTRDIDSNLMDAQSLLAAAQSEARANNLNAAMNAVESAIRAGASGPYVTYLRGCIALREGRYREAYPDLRDTLAAVENRDVSTRFFQAAVGAREFSAAARAYGHMIAGENIPTSLKSRAIAALAIAASEDSASGIRQFKELCAAINRGEYADQADYVCSVIVSIGAILNEVHAVPSGLINLLAADPESDPKGVQTCAIAFARLGRFSDVQALLHRGTAAGADPETLLSAALVAQTVDPAAYRKALEACAHKCDAITAENNCSTMENTLTVLFALIVSREAHDRLAASLERSPNEWAFNAIAAPASPQSERSRSQGPTRAKRLRSLAQVR